MHGVATKLIKTIKLDIKVIQLDFLQLAISRGMTIHCVTKYHNTKMQQYVSWIVRPKIVIKKKKSSLQSFSASTTLNYI